MKFLKQIIIGLLILTFFSCQAETKEISKIIDEVKKEFAPDSRVAIFDISFETNGNKTVLTGETNLQSATNTLLKKLERIDVKDKIVVLPASELGEEIYGIINVSVCNIRSKPKSASELSTQSLLGHTLRLYKKNDLYYAQTTDNYLGWINKNEFIATNKAEYTEWQNAKKIIFTDDFGFSYSDANTNSRRVSDLVMGNLLKFIETKDEFYKVEYPDGRRAFVPVNQCEEFEKWKIETKPNAEDILNTAYRFVGNPYLWGGTSAKMLDCSGFSKLVYFMNGILLPRDASQQVFVGETIIENVEEYEKLKPADLVFFGVNRDGKERITHVGIYIGDGKYIHQKGPVVMNSFKKSDPDFNEYRYNHFKRGQRVISSVGKNGVKLVRECEFYK
ncbi:MAG: NlpC/P60 family protein [Candidatus Marinimicrobia bacterium]|nr:NlpC/P60 family protein [Candidatus Neomarinimicrobiota bacterium]